MKNKYNIVDDYVEIFLKDRKGVERIAFCDLEDFDKVNAYKGTFYASHRPKVKDYYCMITIYCGKIDGKYKYKLIYLHQIVLGTIDTKLDVDHVNHKTLDNRKINLVAGDACGNMQNRNRPNVNNNTGFRNVSYIAHEDKYRVQIMKKGVRYNWTFENNELEKAIEFSMQKRIELFGRI